MDVVEKIVAGHRSVSEKRDILKKLVLRLDSDNFFWDKGDEISSFFRREVRDHLSLEERVLFPVLKKVLTGMELETMRNIESEHAPILHKLNGFEVIAENHKRYASRATREHMIRAAYEILELVSAHAGREDELLFPRVREKLSSSDLRELEDLYFRHIQS